MIYLCSAYSKRKDGMTDVEYSDLLEQRYREVEKVVANMMKKGETVFSPIVHCHNMARRHDMPKTWDFWKQHDTNFIRACSQVYVLMTDNWKKSHGVSEEIKFANQIGKPVIYIEHNIK